MHNAQWNSTRGSAARFVVSASSICARRRCPPPAVSLQPPAFRPSALHCALCLVHFVECPHAASPPLASAVRRREHLHGDVTPRGGARGNQSVAGIPRLRCGARAHGARGRVVLAGVQPVRAHGGAHAAARGACRPVQRQYAAPYDPDREITITAGATEALFSTITALVHPGDEVLLFEPCYDSYVPAVQLAGGVPVFTTLRYRTTPSTGMRCATN